MIGDYLPDAGMAVKNGKLPEELPHDSSASYLCGWGWHREMVLAESIGSQLRKTDSGKKPGSNSLKAAGIPGGAVSQGH